MKRLLRWTALVSPGAEELVLQTGDGVMTADSVVEGGRAGPAVRVTYHLELDPAWQVRRVSVTTGDEQVTLHRDTSGTWRDGNGVLVPALTGCTDVDISVTPFTNTLPIRRLQLAEGESAEIRVAYIQLPGPAIRPVRQRYTNLGGGRYRYEALESGFTAEITVDADGLVVEYPGLFRRLS